MSAEPTPSPKNKFKGIVDRFREDYSVAVAEAKISAEHTATEGWQKLYSDHDKQYRALNRDNAKLLRNIADRVELSGSNEDIEKEIGDVKKLAASTREQWDIYHRSTVDPVRKCVDPVRKCVDECERIITEYRQRAEADEMSSPLTEIGLVEVMRSEILKHPRAVWDADTGKVEVRQP